MKGVFYFLLVGISLVGCSQSSNKTNDFSPIDFEIINIPYHSIDSIYLDDKILMVDIVDSSWTYNPTIFVQSFTWYVYQLEKINADFDSIQINQTMPMVDSINSILAYQMSRKFIKGLRVELDNTLIGNFMRSFFKLNWETKANYKNRQTSVLDKVNLLFARNIDTAYYKTNFPNNDVRFGIDCMPIFETYFFECLENERKFGHQIVGEIEKSTNYFNENDKAELSSLLNLYSKKFKNYKTAPNTK